jgi:hypothetical protein
MSHRALGAAVAFRAVPRKGGQIAAALAITMNLTLGRDDTAEQADLALSRRKRADMTMRLLWPPTCVALAADGSLAVWALSPCVGIAMPVRRLGWRAVPGAGMEGTERL